MPTPQIDEMRRLMHALREPVGAFVIHLALLDDEAVSEETRRHLESMLVSVQRMVKALAEITASLGLEAGPSTPLDMLEQQRVGPRRARSVKAHTVPTKPLSKEAG